MMKDKRIIYQELRHLMFQKEVVKEFLFQSLIYNLQNLIENLLSHQVKEFQFLDQLKEDNILIL